MPNSITNNRQELDINLPLVLLFSSLLTIAIYSLLLPFRDTYLGILLIDRGITQYLVVFLSCFVISSTLDKFFKIKTEFKTLKKLEIPPNIPLENHKSVKVKQMCEYFSESGNLVDNRLSRVLSAYIYSGSRKTSGELALDDSSFYLSASESSYTFPRILVWAIPLLGFVGTVLGISQAVNGFSGFLDSASEVDQIREGIGTVTGGLAVAFDTTLLALLLSVVVMIPLVLVERIESQLLLQIDIFINDKILPRFSEKETSSTSSLDKETISKTINQAIKESLPTPEELIQPAEIYAREAAQNLLKEFLHQFNQIQTQESELVEGIKEVNRIILTDREKIIQSYQEQQNFNATLVDDIKLLIHQIKEHNNLSQVELDQQINTFKNQLENIAFILDTKINSLQKSSEQIAQLSKLENSFSGMVRALESAGKMENSLNIIQEQITLLQPVIKDLSKPRVVRLIEEIEP
ncbi:MotA/TolQ/ExbB proton channel family protein [Cyanobacterium stanieri LEGE 03274]|uniref:MotA/TolQ/ExbB proton channel family protein n=1 Tax=Cyanobacterium stanieri LEGE 03274 TaxID=1828756 RepID=A0ABR9V6E1_9CHRO|nr:MotA/TolQ/ExbB proton channel family protein [Cyanobacterium stanieri]MBE9223467.1 MotA/TolQ/ExbB proton channel family protein [Cyanobacterium stanieri LEGE 03274]